MTGSAKARSAGVGLALALAAIALRAPHFDLPLERDEGEYAYIAWRLAAGETPYLDWFDQKPPGVFLAYRLALALPGDPVVAIRAVAALFAAGSAVAVWALARALLGVGAGAVAGLLYVFLSADPMLQGPVANTELFMVPWIAAAALLALRTLRDARSALATGLALGLAIGIATAFKQVAAVNAPLLLAVIALRAPRAERGRRTAQATAGFVLGAALVWGAIALWFWRRGAFAPALDAIVLHNLDYTAELTLSERWGAIRYFLPQIGPSQALAWLLAGLGLVKLWMRADRFPALFLTGFAAFNAVGVSASGFFFPHYFQQLLPAVAALAAGVLPERDARRTGAFVAVAIALAPLVVAALSLARLSPEEASRRIYPDDHFDIMPAIGAEVAAITPPDQRVFVFGSEPEILFYARRASASRYIFLFPVYGSFPDADRRQAEVIAELEAHLPASIVYAPLESFYGRGRPQRLSEWTDAMIDRGYRLHAAVVAGADDAHTLHRLAPGADPRKFLVEWNPWATIFVRVDRDPHGAAQPREP